MSFALFFICGFILTVGTIERTIQASEGRIWHAGAATLAVTMTTWFSITAAADHDCLLYGSFAAGTVIATMLTARWHRKPEDKTNERS